MTTSFKNTQIGTIPTDWEVSDVGHCFDVRQGKQVSAKTRAGNNQRFFLRTSNVFWGKLDLSDLDKMNFTPEEVSALTLRSHDLLVCEGGEIGRTAIWKNELEGCLYQNHLHRLRVKNNSVDPEFMMFWLIFGFYVERIYFGLGNKTTIPNLSQSRLKILPLPVPNPKEQKRIARILTTVQSGIEIQERIVETTTELKWALLQILFTEGPNEEPQKQTEIGPIPKSWDAKPLGEIGIKFRSGGTPSTKNTEYWGGDIPWTTSKRLTDTIYLNQGERNITRLGLKDSSTSLIPKNNLLVSTRVTVGKAAVNTIDMAISQDLTGILLDNSKYNSEFLAYQMKTSRIQRLCDSIKRGATIKGITRDDLKQIEFAIPTLEVQTQISGYLLNLDKKIEKASTKKRLLEALFNSMLYSLMTGQVRVNNTEF